MFKIGNKLGKLNKGKTKPIRKDRLYSWRKIKKCEVCGGEFLPRYEKSKFCSKRCHTRKYVVYLKNDPIKYRAHTMASGIKGFFIEDAEKMVREHLNTPCKYCQDILTIENMSLDHKEPLLRNKKHPKGLLEELNKKENLQIICKRCNFFKLSLTDEEYTKLANFLRNEPEIQKKLLRRIWIKPFGKRTW